MTQVLHMKVLCLQYWRSCDFHVISMTYMHFGRSHGWATPWSSKYKSRASRSLHEARGSQVVSPSIHLTSSLRVWPAVRCNLFDEPFLLVVLTEIIEWFHVSLGKQFVITSDELLYQPHMECWADSLSYKRRGELEHYCGGFVMSLHCCDNC